MKKIIVFIIIIILAIIFIPLAWYFLSPLFIDQVVDEENSFTQAVITSQSTFVDADSFHKVSGSALFLEEEGKQILRFENFEATNGPDLKVYLATDLDATEYVSLGELRGNIGNQNYVLADNIAFAEYTYVLIWCEQFGVLFGSAQITSTNK